MLQVCCRCVAGVLQVCCTDQEVVSHISTKDVTHVPAVASSLKGSEAYLEGIGTAFFVRRLRDRQKQMARERNKKLGGWENSERARNQERGKD